MLPESTVKILLKMLFAIRYLVLVSLYFLAKAISQPENAVLAYHSVGLNGSKYSVEPAEFRKQIYYLRKNYKIITLKEIYEYLDRKRRLPKKSVAITFDDGFYDNYSNVYPILKHGKTPFTIFLATSYVDRNMQLDNKILPMLSWDHIKEMSNNNVTLGAHTSNHPDLSKLDEQSAEREIVESKTEIENKTGNRVEAFAYPSGRHTESTEEIVKSAGFRCAFGEMGILRPDINRYSMPRVEVDRSVDLTIFKMRLTMATDWYGKLRKTLVSGFERSELGLRIMRSYLSSVS